MSSHCLILSNFEIETPLAFDFTKLMEAKEGIEKEGRERRKQGEGGDREREEGRIERVKKQGRTF